MYSLNELMTEIKCDGGFKRPLRPTNTAFLLFLLQHRAKVSDSQVSIFLPWTLLPSRASRSPCCCVLCLSCPLSKSASHWGLSSVIEFFMWFAFNWYMPLMPNYRINDFTWSENNCQNRWEKHSWVRVFFFFFLVPEHPITWAATSSTNASGNTSPSSMVVGGILTKHSSTFSNLLVEILLPPRPGSLLCSLIL